MGNHDNYLLTISKAVIVSLLINELSQLVNIDNFLPRTVLLILTIGLSKYALLIQRHTEGRMDELKLINIKFIIQYN